MASFILQNSRTTQRYRIDIVDHWRVDGRHFQRSSPNLQADGFTLLLFDADTNSPINIFHGKNQLTEYWAGVKRAGGGADFRTRFWPEIRRRISKYLVATELSIPVGDISDSDILASQKHLLDSLDPDDMKDSSIDATIVRYTGRGPRNETRIRPGTVANIDTDYDFDTDGTNKDSTGTDMRATTSSTGNYGTGAACRFPLSALPSGVIVNDVDFQVHIIADAFTESSDTVSCKSYNSDGIADPSADSAGTSKNRINSGATHATFLVEPTPRSVTVDLGATVDGFVAANIDSPDIYTVALYPSMSGGSERCHMETIENSGSDPATLIVDYSQPPSIASVTPDSFEAAETGVVIAGSAFEAAQGTGKVELGDNSDYGSANLEEQTIEAWGDTEITFTVVQGALSIGTLYVFVTTDSALVSSGSEITLEETIIPDSGGPPSPGSVLLVAPTNWQISEEVQLGKIVELLTGFGSAVSVEENISKISNVYPQIDARLFKGRKEIYRKLLNLLTGTDLGPYQSTEYLLGVIRVSLENN